MVGMANKIKGVLSPSVSFVRALKRNQHARSELCEARCQIDVGYGGQRSHAVRLINAAEEILLVVHELLTRECDHHKAQEEARNSNEAER